MPIITISRGSLSGGRALAECLADRLGYPCVAAEIVRGAAAKLGVSMEDVQGKFETSPGLWARLVRDREKYVLAVRTALLEGCAEGSLVYHGLAGQFLLRDLRGVLRIRLIAPLDVRLRTLTDHHRMGREAAEEFIRDVDNERRRWVRVMYGEDVESPALYDLTVNLRTLSLDTACEVIAEAAGQPQYEITAEARAAMEALRVACHERLDALTSGE
ncbi:MAG TPA: cytidylate kinase-like family protein [Longimicrobiales bacterium]